MISLSLALELKDAGLVWVAELHDFFAVPDRGLDERVFVISDMPANLDVFRGWPVVTFHGTAEWALDYILTAEVVWLPREEQLREALQSTLGGEEPAPFTLTCYGGLYHVTVQRSDETLAFSAFSASDAYGQALLYCLLNPLAK